MKYKKWDFNDEICYESELEAGVIKKQLENINSLLNEIKTKFGYISDKPKSTDQLLINERSRLSEKLQKMIKPCEPFWPEDQCWFHFLYMSTEHLELDKL